MDSWDLHEHDGSLELTIDRDTYTWPSRYEGPEYVDYNCWEDCALNKQLPLEALQELIEQISKRQNL